MVVDDQDADPGAVLHVTSEGHRAGQGRRSGTGRGRV
jgi:hypothetical protein